MISSFDWIAFDLITFVFIISFVLGVLLLIFSLKRSSSLGLHFVLYSFMMIGTAVFTFYGHNVCHKSISENRSIAICRTTLESALTEYRSDFGTEATVSLSESDNLMPTLSKEYIVDGKKFGPYIYDQEIIDQCATRKWRIHLLTAKTLRVDLVNSEDNNEE